MPTQMTWRALGPFPYGTREDWLQCPSAVRGTVKDLACEGDDSVYSSAIATDGIVSWQTVMEDDRGWLHLHYPKDWRNDVYSSGWACLQHVYYLVRTFHVEEKRNFLCLLESGLAFEIDGTSYAGDIYGYGLKEIAPEMAGHFVSLKAGKHTVVLRAVYEDRIFGGLIPPDISIRFQMMLIEEDAELYLDGKYAIVPNCVDGWLAGRHVGVSVRNISSRSITIVAYALGSNFTDSPARKAFRSHIKLISGQSQQLPIEIRQRSALASDTDYITVTISYRVDGSSIVRKCDSRMPVNHRALKETYTYTFMDSDNTISKAVVRWPKNMLLGRREAAARRPVILMLHGAGVDIEPGDEQTSSLDAQQDAYVVWPTGRCAWGMDWHALSLKSAFRAVESLIENCSELIGEPIGDKIDSERTFIMGHSNGSQGAMHLAQRYCDKIVGGIFASGYTKIQSYVSYAGWSTARFDDPALLGLLNASLIPWDNEIHASNLTGLSDRICLRHGQADDNVPVSHSRNLKEIIDAWNPQMRVLYDEIPERPHWWQTVLSERQAFVDQVMERTPPETPRDFTLTVGDPFENNGKGGIRVLQLKHPGRLGRLVVTFVPQSVRRKTVKIETQNVKRLSIANFNEYTSLTINGKKFDTSDELTFTAMGNEGSRTFEIGDGIVYLNDDRVHLPHAGGQLIRLMDSPGPLRIVIGRKSRFPCLHLSMATRLAAQYFLYIRLNSVILFDDEVDMTGEAQGNVVIIGSHEENTLWRLYTQSRESHTQNDEIDCHNDYLRVGGQTFNDSMTGLIALLDGHLLNCTVAMAISAVTPEAYEQAMAFVPLRTGRPLPDWVLLGKGHCGGSSPIVGAGFWTSDWTFNPIMSYLP